MVETNNVYNALKTLNIAENIIFTQIQSGLPDEDSRRTTLLSVKQCLRKLIAKVAIIGNVFQFYLTVKKNYTQKGSFIENKGNNGHFIKKVYALLHYALIPIFLFFGHF